MRSTKARSALPMRPEPDMKHFKPHPTQSLAEWQRSVDKRRFMASRFVRRGASYWSALVAANKLFPLAPYPADFAISQRGVG